MLGDKLGEKLLEMARGVDRDAVDAAVKGRTSIGAQVNRGFERSRLESQISRALTH